MSEVPFERLGIPDVHRKPLLPGAPLKLRQTAAAGKLPLPPDVAVSVAFVLLSDEDDSVKTSAAAFLKELPEETLLKIVGRETHPKVLEFLVEHHLQDERFASRVVNLRQANSRTLQLMAQGCGPGVLEAIALNQERLILEPELYAALKLNSRSSTELLRRVESFLRMQGVLEPQPPGQEAPEAPVEPTPKRPTPKPNPSSSGPKKHLSPEELEAEILAAIAGTQAPKPASASGLSMFDLGEDEEEQPAPAGEDGLGEFEFSFDEETVEFDWALTSDEKKSDDDEDEEVNLSLEQQVANMSVGQKIKLAYTGNQTTRKLLLRDSNKLVSSAVVKSGRMTDAEILATAGNRNIPTEILNYIARDKEQLRKYPIRVALATNPKTPVPVALRLLRDLSKADLRSLSMNRNVSGVVFETAGRLYKQKFQK